MPYKELLKFVLAISSNPKNVLKVESFLEHVNDHLQLDDSQFNKLLVATTEAVNNSIVHGNKRDPRRKVVITCEVNHAVLIVRVHDEGPGVDTSNLPNPLAEENLMRENGRGVFLMRSMMDSVEFDKTPDGAEVIMTMAL
ncbi:MAG: ATP-binding protein [Ignavibacteriae bacterium]|nr:ATP-binding protein [Ignavibacteriota bacterium]